jgi:hypothetical protein
MIKLENQLKDLMLKHVEFKIDGKVIKRGKVKVFNTKQFFVKFKLEYGDDIKEYEIPYPYRVDKLRNGYLFDYCLSAFCPRTEEVYWRMKTLSKEDCSKIHENYLFVIALSS